MAATADTAQKPELTIVRLLAAPPQRVFDAWTSRELFLQWLGPKDFVATHCEIDVRPGGAYRACIRSPEGNDYWMRGVYREVTPPRRLVFTFAWEEEGERGLDNIITVTLAEQGGKTRLEFHQAPFQSVSERDSHNEGWSESFDRLDALVSAT
jgi:uncharacterized protein YndB with AHSA1/START domain